MTNGNQNASTSQFIMTFKNVTHFIVFLNGISVKLVSKPLVAII